ncbi:phosphoglycerate kinase [Flavobacteriaceae bacterium]|nr:phosphoglycerate kinase [Flavobacteriaceae bacterium]|tara:strand:- start:6878 stop:8065 length:1188 start_codon:yes stop_codon:yes gene_type:complete
MISIDKQNFKGKKTIIRVDFNVPMSSSKTVLDPSRIHAARSTILKVINDGGSCILMSHLGRPEGKDQKFSLKHIVSEVEKTLNKSVFFAKDSIGEKTEKLVKSLQPGQVLMLENLRFYKEETEGNKLFAQKLASYADYYINDAFGTAHRAHASTTIIAQFFKNKKFSGHLLSKEVEAIKKVLESGQKPVLAILGGAKVSSKITIIESIIGKADEIIIGGGMAFTFIKALGGNIGNSICENDKLDLALNILKKAKLADVKIHLPVDVICSKEFSDSGIKTTEEIYNIPENWQGLDAGPKSRAIFDKVVKRSKTILWNGPIGVFELESFSEGTISLGKSIIESTKKGAFSLVGGGDSVAAVKKFNFQSKVSYVSTGGGAMLESLEGKELPGIIALSN